MRSIIHKLIETGVIFIALSTGLPLFAQSGGLTIRCTVAGGGLLSDCPILIERSGKYMSTVVRTNSKGEYHGTLISGDYKLSLLNPKGNILSSKIVHVPVGRAIVVDFDADKAIAAERREGVAKAAGLRESPQSDNEQKRLTNLKQLFDQGQSHFRQKRYIEAAQVFEQALPLAKDKNIPVVLAALGDSYGLAAYVETQPDLRAQYLSKALENYGKALRLDPGNALLQTKYDKLSAVIKPPANPRPDYRKELTATSPAQVENVDQPPSTRSHISHGYALVVAVENYLPPLPTVPFAGTDAAVVKRYLIQAFGIPEEHVKGLADPTLGQMRVGVNWLMNQAKSDGSNQTVLYVYYAGHGVGDVKTRSPYLLPIDADPSDVAETGLSLKEMAGSLGALKARSFLLIDACFSGAASRARAGEASGLTRGARPAYLEVDMPENPNVIIFSASTGQQLSNMLEPARHGLFTYYLLSGLHGRAADVNGQVTLRSLYGYVHAQVQTAAQRMNREQEPTLSPRLEVLGDTAGMRLVTLAR